MKTNRECIFKGFSPQGLEFLQSVKNENSKAWFEENKHVYREYLLEPLQDLGAALGEHMLAIDPYFEIRPLVDKTISRIYRDTRFSNDKSLFKNKMWITFKRPIKNWKDFPTYFFEIYPHAYCFGMGYYSASRNTMDKFREVIDKNPSVFLQAISFYRKAQNVFQIEGETFKRFLNNDYMEEIQDWYQRKTFYLVCNKSIDGVLFSPALVNELISGFNMLKPLYHYLLKLTPEYGNI